ncbi:DUF4238 domain-containing protein [Caulobacter sp. LARHSG274]
MADNKNQHFVPRCHLKPFSLDGAGLAINLFNLTRCQAIESAPLKHQCSRDYFYGKDPLLERAINTVENGYVEGLRRLLERTPRIDPVVNISLKRFIYLQQMRTEAASRSAAMMAFAMLDVPGNDLPRPSLKEAMFEGVQAAMLAYADTMSIVDDLQLCLVRNRSNTPFITSDNPAVLTNRWHHSDERTQGRSFGAKTAGAIFVMPLSPSLLALLFDPDVYAVAQRRGVVDLIHNVDARALNQHQVLNCAANLYFRDWERRGSIAAQVEAVKMRRPDQLHEVHYAVKAETTDWGSRYDVRDLASIQLGRDEVLIHVIGVKPEPTRWPSFLTMRPDGVVWSNGTGAGFTRQGCLEAGFVRGQNYRRSKACR